MNYFLGNFEKMYIVTYSGIEYRLFFFAQAELIVIIGCPFVHHGPSTISIK